MATVTPLMVASAGKPREVVRCSHRRCGLNQFMTTSGTCRRCGKPLHPEPPDASATQTDTPADLEAAAAFEQRDIARDVALTITRLRTAAGLSQRELADRLGLPRTYISKLENQKALPTLMSMYRLADAFGIPVAKMVDPEYARWAFFVRDPFLAEMASAARGVAPDKLGIVLVQARALAIGRKPARAANDDQEAGAA